MEDINFIGQIFPQNCGDSLIVLKKTNKKKKKTLELFIYELFTKNKNILY